MSIYIYVSIQKERDGGGLDDQLPFGRGVYLSLLESIQDAVRMAELITDGTVIGQLCPQRRGWKGSHNFNSSKHLLVDHHYLLALGNGTVMKTVWNFPMAGENDDPPIWEWIVFPSYQNIKWVFPIFSYYPLEYESRPACGPICGKGSAWDAAVAVNRTVLQFMSEHIKPIYTPKN